VLLERKNVCRVDFDDLRVQNSSIIIWYHFKEVRAGNALIKCCEWQRFQKQFDLVNALG
jgi:hypothetical protein